MKKDLFIGVMSGTSADGIDAVLADLSNHHFKIVDSISTSYPARTRNDIRQLCSPGDNEIDLSASLGVEISKITGALINKLVVKTGINPSEITAIGYHGQTIRHHPNAEHPYSVQIGCPSTLAFLTKITTITDFRMADIAAGGQGAPLVPAFHQAAFHNPEEHRIILNIGGIANISYLPSNLEQSVIGFDTGPGNTLLDEWILLHKGKHYDEKGSWAATGKLIPELLDSLMSDLYFEKPIPKSTGKERFNIEWLSTHLKALDVYKQEDVQRTLTEFTAKSITKGIQQIIPSKHKYKVFVCGGGIHNATLMSTLRQYLDYVPISSTEEVGIPPQLVESAAFAWLAKQTLSKLPGNLPSVTGAASKRILGGIYFH